MMFRFKSGQVDVLVATDILSRGIDIDDIAMVLNYDVPRDAEDYVHRIGRTARAERDGKAVTFISEEDIRYFLQIERFLEREVTKNPLPDGIGEGPEYKAAPRANGKGKGLAVARPLFQVFFVPLHAQRRNRKRKQKKVRTTTRQTRRKARKEKWQKQIHPYR